jgi:predicted Fe-Mo cluster-binding NifX family protein
MKVAISTKGTKLKDPTDQRFGHCPVFLIVDTETLHVDALPNEASQETGGAGISAAKLLTRQELDAVITGNLGPNAVRILESEGLPVYVGATGTARQALKQYRSGRLTRATATVGRRRRGMRSFWAATQGKMEALRPGQDRHFGVGSKGSRGNGNRGGFPPSAGLHAGAEPSLRAPEKEKM